MTGIDRIGEKKEKKREKREQAPGGGGGNAGFLYEPSHHTGRPTQHTLISGLTTENRAENRKVIGVIPGQRSRVRAETHGEREPLHVDKLMQGA